MFARTRLPVVRLTATRLSREPSRWIGVAFTLSLFVVLVGCGGGSKTSSNAAASTASGSPAASEHPGDPAATNEMLRGIVTSRKACDLLKRPDAEAAVGQPLPQNTVNITLGMCDYNAADFSAGASVTVGSWESVKGAATAGAQPVAIAGVGDEALNLNSSNGSILYVRRGNEGFLLSLHGPKIDPLPDHGLVQEKELALKILRNFS
ncbi:MAG: hypothetical protein M3167_03540 [Acidobacteriota bacterium]|nr:hypothetical protein [Acidobacteriota bacterium]